MPQLVPIDHDPFGSPQLVPVDHDPFSVEAYGMQPDPSKLGAGPETALDTALRAGIMGAGGSDVVNAIGQGGKVLPALQRGETGAAVGAGLSALLSGVLLGAGVVAPENKLAGVVGENALTKGIRAYHGSPYDFSAFDMSKIGSGEGVQAYSHGLYFAGSEPTAEFYLPRTYELGPKVDEFIRDRLNTDMIPPGDLQRVKNLGVLYKEDGGKNVDLSQLASSLYASVPSARVLGGKTALGPHPELEKLLRDLSDEIPKRGHMYEVNLDVDPEHLLDWDKPLSEQSEYVKQALSNISPWKELGSTPENFLSGKKIIDHIQSSPGFYNISSTTEVQAKTTQALRDAGISGVRYLDQGSRQPLWKVSAPNLPSSQTFQVHTEENANQWAEYLRSMGHEPTIEKLPQTSNYVIFDDKLIDIIRKYGLAPLIAGGAASVAGDADAATHVVPVDHDPFAP